MSSGPSALAKRERKRRTAGKRKISRSHGVTNNRKAPGSRKPQATKAPATNSCVLVAVFHRIAANFHLHALQNLIGARRPFGVAHRVAFGFPRRKLVRRNLSNARNSARGTNVLAQTAVNAFCNIVLDSRDSMLVAVSGKSSRRTEHRAHFARFAPRKIDKYMTPQASIDHLRSRISA